MKPHRLEITAFGAYGGHEVVDFDLLADEGLFLIHGPTGAGKTTLLDAMCFALYGEIPGAKGKERLVSHHVSLGTKPLVEFEFSVSGGRHRVTRSPEYVANKRGGGTTTKSGTARLDRFEGGEWTTTTAKITEVRSEIEHLVGLTARQFQQVILLPQGKFERVLQADTESREELLRTLFDTDLFAQMTTWLDERARVAGLAVTAASGHLDELWRQAQAKWTEMEPFVEASCPTARLAETPEPTTSTAITQGHFDALVESASTLQRAATGAVEQEHLNLSTELERQRDVTAVADRWDRRETALAQRQRLRSQSESIEATRQALDRAASAELLRQSLETVESARRSYDELADTRLRLSTTVARVLQDAPGVPADLRSIDIASLQDDSVHADIVGRIRSRRDLVRSQIEAGERVAELRHEANRFTREATGHRERMASIARELQQLRTTASSLDAQLQAARTSSDRLDDLTQAAEQAALIRDAALSLATATEHANAAVAKRAEAERRSLDRRSQWSDLRERYLDGVAAELARDLEPGEGCPVCGSVEHPAPAAPDTDSVDRRQVDAAEAEAIRASDAFAAADEAAQAAKLGLARLEATAGGQQDPAVASSDASVALAALEHARRAAERGPAISTQLHDITNAVTEAESHHFEATAAATTAEAAATTTNQLAEQTQRAIEAAVGPSIDLPAAATHLDRLLESLDAIRSAITGAVHARGGLATATARLDADLARSPFASSAEAASCLMGEHERHELSQRIHDHDGQVTAVSAALEAPDLSDLPDVRPDTIEAERAVTTAREALTHAVAHEARLDAAHRDLARLADEHRIAGADLAEQRELAAQTRAVADRCSGKLAPRISIQRWVLASYLAEICDYANLRLAGMTAGRYSLLVDRGAARHAGRSGLGLRVRDAHTGEDRDVSTLSGGETFQASLALALGVADTVAAHTGGIELGALFVDEGFGSLDPEALQLAMDELDRLREGGRMVGVISHVAALRERIHYGVEVVKSDTGSSLRVCEVVPV